MKAHSQNHNSITLTYLKAHLSQIIDEIIKTGIPKIIKQNNRTIKLSVDEVAKDAKISKKKEIFLMDHIPLEEL